MFIQIQDTPNPLVLKFLPGREVMPSGTVNFSSATEATSSALAVNLFSIKGVTGVLFGADFISVTKSLESEWSALKTLVMECIANYLSLNNHISVKSASGIESQDQSAIVKEIIELLDTRIRPAVAADGGEIIFSYFEEGVVYLQLQGACASCPSSISTLKGGIENMLRYYIPEVLEVRAV